ncbi:MAG: hypothetical protein OXG04_13210 [Acidobacteria bacterium]|nr:hypothetical protein [Acidobacteriota bacterium]
MQIPFRTDGGPPSASGTMCAPTSSARTGNPLKAHFHWYAALVSVLNHAW